MYDINDIDRSFREIENIISILDMVILEYFGPLNQENKNKIMEVSTYLKAMLDGTNINFKKVVERENELMQLKEDFIANINHELRTPLTSILGTTELLIDNIDDYTPEELVVRLKRINNSSHDLLRLVNEILELSSLNSGFVKPNIMEINLEEIFSKTVEAFDEICARKKIKLTSKANDIQIINDPDHISRIVTNLVSNAYKFTRDGEIVLKTEQIEDKIKIIVSDTGAGMTEKQMENIFSRFYQGKVENNKAQGTGIGLNLVKKLADIHNGDVLVESRVGVGSVFTVSLPSISPLYNRQNEV